MTNAARAGGLIALAVASLGACGRHTLADPTPPLSIPDEGPSTTFSPPPPAPIEYGQLVLSIGNAPPPDRSDADTCAAFYDEEDRARARLLEDGLDGQFETPDDLALDGAGTSPADYLSAEDLAELASTTYPLAPTWLPSELLGRQAHVVLFEGSQDYLVDWADSPDTPELRLSVFVQRLRQVDVDTGLEIHADANVNGRVAELRHDEGTVDAISWTSGGYLITVQSTNLDPRMNCGEFLAVARSIRSI